MILSTSTLFCAVIFLPGILAGFLTNNAKHFMTNNKIVMHQTYDENVVEIDRRDALQKAILATIQISLSTSLPATSITPPPVKSFIAKPGPIIRLGSYKPPVLIPRVGYSLYKTNPSQAEKCVSLALAAGVRHFDVATLYKSNSFVGNMLQSYIKTGSTEIPSEATVYSSMDKGKQQKQQQKRRSEIFISHKISNEEQSISKSDVRQAVQNEMKQLNVDYLDLCSIHSPLTDKAKRLATYETLLDMKEEGLIKAIGVCNYGCYPLDEIIKAGFPPPSVIQLELSPFNQHIDVAQWAKNHGAILSCGAWSLLSSVSGPQEGWTTVAAMAKEKAVTKQQILIRWAMHKGYISVPRSGVGSKIERKAISENSFEGVSDFILSKQDIDRLNELEEGLKAGRLGRRDGWGDDDVKGEDWDPTEFVRS